MRIKMRTVVARTTIDDLPPRVRACRTPYEIGNNSTGKCPFSTAYARFSCV